MVQATGFQGEIVWGTSKPDSTPKKQLDVSRLVQLGRQAPIRLVDGFANVVAEFRKKSDLIKFVCSHALKLVVRILVLASD